MKNNYKRDGHGNNIVYFSTQRFVLGSVNINFQSKAIGSFRYEPGPLFLKGMKMKGKCHPTARAHSHAQHKVHSQECNAKLTQTGGAGELAPSFEAGQTHSSVPPTLLRDFSAHGKNKGKLIPAQLKVHSQSSACGQGNTFLQALNQSPD